MQKARSTKYQRLAKKLCDKILSGQYPPGIKLPGHRVLAQQYNVSTITANHALDELLKAGLAVRKPRSGTFVAETTGKLNEVFVVLPDTESQDSAKFADYWSGIASQASEYDVQINSLQIGQFKKQLAGPAEHFSRKGILLVMVDDKKIFPILSKLKIPVVMVGREDTLFDYCACEDRRRACRNLVIAMHKSGAKHIAFLANRNASNHRQAEEGFIEAMDILGIGKKYICNITSNDPCWQAEEFLKTQPEVDAVIPMGAFLPIATMPAILKADRKILIGVMTETSSMLQLRETAIIAHYSQKQAGKIAMELLREIAQKKITAPVTRYTSYEILYPEKN